MLGVLALGCREERWFATGAVAGDLVVRAVVAGSAGSEQVLEVESFVSRGDADPVFELAPGSRAFAFIISPEQLVDVHGARLPEATLASARARTIASSASEGGACGRCRALWPAAPQVVYPGDSCPPPPFAKERRWPADAPDPSPRLLASLRLDWPGDCACRPRPDEAVRMARGLATLDRDEDPLLPYDVAQIDASSGKLALVLPALPTPALAVVEPRAGAPIESASLPFPVAPRRVLAAGYGPDRLLLSAHVTDEEINLGFEIHLAAPGPGGASPWAVRATSPVISTRPRGLAAFPERGSVLVFGELADPLAQTYPVNVCTIALGQESVWGDESFTCEGFAPEGLEAILGGGELGRATALSSGSVVLSGTGQGILILEDVPSAVDLRAVSRTVLSDSIAAGTYAGGAKRYAARPVPDLGTAEMIGGVGASGNRVYVCTEDLDLSVPDLRVMSASISRAALDPGVPGLEWRRAACVHRARCGGFSALPGGGVRLSIAGGGHLDFDSSGARVGGGSGQGCADAVTPDAPSEIAGIDRPVRSIWSGKPGWTIAESTDGALFVRDERTPGARFVRVYGRAVPAAEHPGAIVVRDGVFWVFSDGGRGRRVEIERANGGGGLQSRSVRFDLGSPFEPNDTVLSAARDSRTDTILVLGPSWIRRVTLRDPPSESSAVSIDVPVSEPLLGITEIAPGHHVIAAHGGKLLRLIGDDVEPIRIEWDDPLTALAEARPALDRACPEHPADPTGERTELDLFRAIGGGDGVAFAAGCNRALVRVDAVRATGVSAERLFEAQPFDVSRINFDLGAARVLCGDSAILGGAVRVDTAVARLFRPDAPLGITTITLPIEQVPHGSRGVPAIPLDAGPADARGLPFRFGRPILGSGAITGVIGQGDQVRLIVTNRERRLVTQTLTMDGLREDFGYPAAIRASAQNERGELLLATEGGSLLIGPDQLAE